MGIGGSWGANFSHGNCWKRIIILINSRGIMGLSETEIEHSERRTHSRLPCVGTAKALILPDGPMLVGVLENLSQEGCAFSCDNAATAKLNARVDVQMDVSGSALRMLGEVRHIEEDGLAGVEFVEVSSRKAEQVRQLTAELRELEKERLAQLKQARLAAADA
jgi:hypothetical protein